MIYIVLLVLVVFSAFFSSLETGLLSLGEVKIREWAKSEMPPLQIWLKSPAGVITSVLVGNNMVNIAFSSLFTILVIRLAVPAHLTEVISIAGAAVILLTLGEIIPKIFANTHPDKIINLFFIPFMVFYKVIKSGADLLNRIPLIIVGKREKLVSRKELNQAIKDIKSEDNLERMLEGVFFLTKSTVGDVMTPRKMIYAIDINWQYEKIMEAILKSRYSRVPVYSEKFDNVIGFIYIKDIIGELNCNKVIDFKRIIRTAYLTYPGRNCHHIFWVLRNKRVHCSIVKSGERVVGLVTIEDLIEEVVGEIYDEYDYNFHTC